MRVLVTGANGMLGIDLCALLEKHGHEVIRTDTTAREGLKLPEWVPLDITDTLAVGNTFERFAPEAVMHVAAYTNVDGCERNPDLAFRVNAFGTWNVAAACSARNIPLTYISTDFVFDGAKRVPYTEYDVPHPLSHYGASKLAGEQHVRQLCRKHFIVRTAWLFGIYGESFPSKILSRAQTNPELSVVVDQVGCPTHTVDLARVLVSLLDSPLFGTYHVVNAGHCSWFEFASKIVEMAGISNVHVKPTPAELWPSPTRRPPYSVLRRYALELQGRDDLRSWQDALAEFLALRQTMNHPLR